MESFRCGNCGAEVEFEAVGTKHRNHCPFCLWSKHLDEKIPGDRRSICTGMMKPVGLTFKKDEGRKGELMIIHKCLICGQIEKNRIAGDDREKAIEQLFEASLNLSEKEMQEVVATGIIPATKEDEREIVTQLYGKPEAEKRFY